MSERWSLPALGDLFKYGPLTSGFLWVGLCFILGSAWVGGINLANRGLWAGFCLFLLGAVCDHGPRILDLVQDDRDPNRMALRTVIVWRSLGSLLATLVLLGVAIFVFATKRLPAWIERWWTP